MKKERERVTKDLAQAEVVSRPMDPEKEEPATWAEGDWNRDGRFDQLDLITALQENDTPARATRVTCWIESLRKSTWPTSSDLRWSADKVQWDLPFA